MRKKWGTGLFGLVLVTAVGCGARTPNSAASSPPTDSPQDTTPAQIRERLEGLIDADRAELDDRRQAYEAVAAKPDDGSAEYAFVRAALAGRVAEAEGLGAGDLVAQAERWARESVKRDPEFDDRAATRMLGTLYVLAPGRMVEHGDSEDGLEMLETLAKERPADPRNTLRLAEAYVSLGEVDPALEPLCRTEAAKARLLAGEQRLLARLIDDIGGREALGCTPES